MAIPLIRRKAVKRLREIHEMSKSYNDKKKKDHAVALLELMRKHAGEINELYENNDIH